MKKYINLILFLICLIVYFTLLFIGIRSNENSFTFVNNYDYLKYGISLCFIYTGIRLLFLHSDEYNFGTIGNAIIIVLLSLAFIGIGCLDLYYIFSEPLSSVIGIVTFPIMLLIVVFDSLVNCFYPFVIYLMAATLNKASRNFRLFLGHFMFVCAVFVILFDSGDIAAIYNSIFNY